MRKVGFDALFGNLERVRVEQGFCKVYVQMGVMSKSGFGKGEGFGLGLSR